MTGRYLAVLLVVALTGGGTSAFAAPRSDPQGPAATTAGGMGPAPGASQEQDPNDKLRSDVSRLLADARVGRVSTIV